MFTSCKPADIKKYNHTYNTSISSNIKSWNIFNIENEVQEIIPSYTSLGLYAKSFNNDLTGYEITSEMAESDPVLVDSQISLDEKEEYYSTSNPFNQVYDIYLNKNAKFENGKLIKSDDYVESLKRLLDPKFANFKADSFYQSDLRIINAENYYKQNRKIIEETYKYLNDNNTFKDPINQGNDGYFYINIGKYTSFLNTIYPNDSSSNLYTLLKDDKYNSTEYLKKATTRIIDAVSYYLIYICDRKANENFYNKNFQKWNEAKLSNDLTSSMYLDHPFIDILEFDNNPIYVRKNHDNPNFLDVNNQEKYSSSSFISDLNYFLNYNFNYNSLSSYKKVLFCNVFYDKNVDFSSVGIKKIDDYKFRLYLSKPIEIDNLKLALTSPFLVDVEKYDKLTIELTPSKKMTSYATNTKDNYTSYGPYKIESYEFGKTVRLVKNENYYGYKDNKHLNQYQMDEINISIIENYETRKTLFMQGKLDELELNNNDNAKYATSLRTFTSYDSYTQKMTINSDFDKLKSRQTAKKNKTILNNLNFRKGLSLGIDRKEFVKKATSGSKPSTFLLNDLYLNSLKSGQSYRLTKEGKEVYNNVYKELGGNPFDKDYQKTALSETDYGYNYQMAVYYVYKAFEEEFKKNNANNLQYGDTIDLEIRVFDETKDETLNMYNFLYSTYSQIINEANNILKLNDNEKIKLNISLKSDQDYYNTAKNGNFDIIFTAWGGLTSSPYQMMQVYIDSNFSQTYEYGFKGKQDQIYLDIDLNDDKKIDEVNEHRSYTSWFHYMVELDSSTHLETKLKVLSQLESGVINRFEAIPIASLGSSFLLSFKIDNITNNYIPLLGYGGFRYMKFNYTNDEYDSFLKTFNYQLEDAYL